MNQIAHANSKKSSAAKQTSDINIGKRKIALVNAKKVPSSQIVRKIVKFSEATPVKAKEPGTNKPLLTSFQKLKTEQAGNSYAGFKPKQEKKPKLAWSLLVPKFALLAIAMLISAYLPSAVLGIQGSQAVRPVLAATGTWGDSQLDVWWPTGQTPLSGTQPFKALLKNKNLNDYKMYWQVDNDRLNEMPNSYADYPHKESVVDLSGWNWKGNGPYTLTFSAFGLDGQKLAEKFVVIYLNQMPSANVDANVIPVSQPQPAPAPAPITASAPVPLPSCPTPASNAFAGCYYKDQNLGSLAFSRTDASINFDWGGGSPDPSVPQDRFSVKWEGSFSFNAGSYNFTATGDDGIKVYVDNNLIMDKWIDQAPTTYQQSVNLNAGSHLVKMLYYENGGGAVAKLSWSQNASQTAAAPNPTPVQLTSYVSSGNPFSGARFYVDPNSNAKRQADAWRSSKPYEAGLMDKIATQPASVWLGGWNGDIKGDVNNLVSAAAGQGAFPVMIAYNIPNRDCGSYSAGGAQTSDAYKSWINSLAAGIGSRKAAVVLEPDAITLTSCLSASELQARYDMLKYAIATLKSLGQTSVYLDAGHAKWLSADELAGKLKSAGISGADGFALNTSNFVNTQDNLAYGQAVSAKVNGKHFIIDTSRNGNGPTPDMQWCNPSGRALGQKPTASTGNPLVDAYYWGKQPGESDGACNGGPSAGVFWPDYALGLAQRAAW